MTQSVQKYKSDFSGTFERDNLNFLSLDEKDNAINSLEMAVHFLRSIDSDIYLWKWVVIALHNAMYGFMICALTKSNYNNVCEPGKKKRGSLGKLISFNEALRRVQSKDHILGYVNTTPLALTKEQAEDVKTLSEMLRNNFEHFMPMGWSIEISGMPDLLKSV